TGTPGSSRSISVCVRRRRSSRSSGSRTSLVSSNRSWLLAMTASLVRGRPLCAARDYPSPAMPSNGMIDLTTPTEQAFLVAVDTGTDDGWSAEDSLAELANLATTAGADVVGAEWQNRRHVDPNWYVGKGKAEELVAAKRETGFDVLVADDELSPAQQRALEG